MQYYASRNPTCEDRANLLARYIYSISTHRCFNIDLLKLQSTRTFLFPDRLLATGPQVSGIIFFVDGAKVLIGPCCHLNISIISLMQGIKRCALS